MNKIIFILILLTVDANLCSAQECKYTLSGQIKSLGEDSLLSGVSVTLEDGRFTAVSDSLGIFKIQNLCKGYYVLRVSYVGRGVVVEGIEITSSQHIALWMEETAAVLDPVVISSPLHKNQNTGILKEVKRVDLAKNSGLPLADILSMLPGIDVLKTGTTVSKPIVHGLHSNRLLIINNGVRQEGQQWGNEHAPEIDPFIADNIAIIKGVDELKYGSDAIGGVMLVNPKPLGYNNFSGEVNTAYFSNNNQFVVSAMAEQQLKNIPQLSFRAQGTFKQASNIRAPDSHVSKTFFMT